MNNKLHNKFLSSSATILGYARRHSSFLLLTSIGLGIGGSVAVLAPRLAHAQTMLGEPVQACVIARDVDLTDALRAQFAQCLGWKSDESSPLCLGNYQPLTVAPLESSDEIHIMADQVSLYRDQRSTLTGHVQVQQEQRIVNAQTAYVYRDSKTNQVTQVEFLGDVRYLEPDRLMIARTATINPQDKSGETTDVLYRFNSTRGKQALPAWGRAGLIKRFANKDYLLKQATYSTCAPQDKAWEVQAQTITLNNAKATGVAKNALLRIHNKLIFYTPYLSFPTNKERKSGFLFPMIGYSNVGGADFGVPYYWNIAPNYDMTLAPHLYSKRGVMMGGEFRYLTPKSTGLIRGSFLPDDKAFKQFLDTNEPVFPELRNHSTNRWSAGLLEQTRITPNLLFTAQVEQVSDDYYLQDFSSNLAQTTERQLLRQADLTYSSEHWLFRGMTQSYQTLHPVNEPPTASVYERLPQLMVQGFYYELPFNTRLNITGQYDQFHWPTAVPTPQGPRFHLNPILSLPLVKPWGFLTPSMQVVENNYQLGPINPQSSGNFNRTIPRYSIDSGLYFDRPFSIGRMPFRQTLEPRLFYLNVPYSNQSAIPIFDSGNMIFNLEQLFRTNRFSGFDRIGDANQLAYALTTRWLNDETGVEKANFSIGQIKYFAPRQVGLCYSTTGYCASDPNQIGYLSPTYDVSPIASRASYFFNSLWGITSDYIWDPATKATDNANLNIHYQPTAKSVLSVGYSYLVNADVTQVRNNAGNNNALHQGLVAYSLPLTEKWSTIGAYSQNISKNYSMMSLFGVQYDSCCWAMRVIGGRTFKNLSADYEPQYNTNVYLQFLLKGLGTLATSDPYNTLNTYIPGYTDPFHN